MEAGHIVYEMGENDLGIVKPFKPLRLPFKGNKGVVIDRRKSSHNVGNGHTSLSDKLIFPVIVGIAQMNVANVSTEIFYSIVTAFAVIAVGVMNVPKCGKTV